MDSQFTTHATNFDTALNGRVDVRTGLYNINLSIVSCSANANLGPKLDLSLMYNPLSTDNNGYGIGFSLGLSYFDKKSMVLNLSSGEKYKVDIVGGKPKIKQRKLSNFNFEKTDDAWVIIWKNGVREFLAGDNTALNLKTVQKISAPSGRSLTFNWKSTNGVPKLQKVSDELNDLVAFDYNGVISTSITVFPGSTEEKSTLLTFGNNYLTKIQNQKVDDAVWQIEYSKVSGLNLASTLIYPTNLKEVVVYKPGMMSFPKKSGLSALPAVVNYKLITNAGQLDQERDITYSDTNYLGNGGVNDWDPDSDSNFAIVGPYSYSTTESHKNTSGNTVVVHQYNKFHLEVSQKTTRGVHSVFKETEYYADESQEFEDQVPQYQLAKTSKTTYLNNTDNSSRVETTVYEFDENGNPVSSQEPDGTKTEYEYYSSAGEQGCPVNPYGFTTYIKCKRITPPASNYTAPISEVYYFYDSLPVLNESASTVIQVQEVTYLDKVKIHTKDTQYINDTQDTHFGRVKSITETIHGKESDYPSTTTFDWKVNGLSFEQTLSCINWDQLSYSKERKQSSLSGVLSFKRDINNNTARYEYDNLSRMTKSVLNEGDDYEQTRLVEYTFASDSNDYPTTCWTDNLGNKLKKYHDGLGREVRVELCTFTGQTLRHKADDSWVVLGATEYDQLGNVIRTQSHDYLHDSTLANNAIFSEQTTEYNDWGSAYKYKSNDGSGSINDYDPITLTSVQTILSGDDNAPKVGTIETVYDIKQRPLIVRKILPDGTEDSEVKNEYDGLGRLCKTTDEMGNFTRWEYDSLSRVVRQNLPDGSSVVKTYQDSSLSDDVVKISLITPQQQEIIIGERKYDSFSRLVEETVGGRKQTFIYDGTLPKPSKIISNDNTVQEYHYNSALSFAPEKVLVGEIEQNFIYDKINGRVTSAEEVDVVKTVSTYYPNGMLESQNIAQGADSYSMSYAWTTLGQMASYNDMTQRQSQYSYDEFGRTKAVNDPSISSVNTYDGYGRLCQVMTQSPTDGSSLTTTTQWDSFSRESSRTIEDSAGNKFIVEYQYYLNSQLKDKQTTVNGEVIRHESYTYDERNRLKTYHCEGSQLPTDDKGNLIVSQSYTMDCLNNITSVDSVFKEGNDNCTYLYENIDDATQLTAILHTHNSFSTRTNLSYDPCGRMTLDENGAAISYDGLGRQASYTVAGNTCQYNYDADDNLISQKVDDNSSYHLIYRGVSQVAEVIKQDGNTNVQRKFMFNGTSVGVEDIQS